MLTLLHILPKKDAFHKGLLLLLVREQMFYIYIYIYIYNS